MKIYPCLIYRNGKLFRYLDYKFAKWVRKKCKFARSFTIRKMIGQGDFHAGFCERIGLKFRVLPSFIKKIKIGIYHE